MVDAAIVMIENAHKRLERAPPGKSRTEVLIEAAVEVGPALFFSLLIITVSFLPIFTLEAQEGRLFKPLAYTKTFAMAAAALLSVLLVPALMTLFVRGRIMPEHKNPVNRFLIWIYRPVIQLALQVQGSHDPHRARHSAGEPVAGLQARHRVHAVPQRRHTVLHAGHAAGDLRHQGRGAAADPGQDHQVLPRGRIRLGQGGPRRDRHRPGPDRNGRDGHQSEAGERVAPWHDRGQAHRRDGQVAAIPRRVQCLDHADQGAHRHAVDRHPHAGWRQGVRQGSGRDRQDREADRGGDQNRAGNLKRLRRARHRRLLPERRSGPGAARPLRIDGGRRAERDRHGARRRAGDHDRRGARALYRQHPLSARLSQRSGGHCRSGAHPNGRRRHGAAPPGREGESCPRSVEHSHRKRAARHLHLCRPSRPRHRQLRRRCAESRRCAR